MSSELKPTKEELMEISSEIKEIKDENENNTEDRKAIEAEIAELLTEINNTKKEMFDLYIENKDFFGDNEAMYAGSKSKTVFIPLTRQEIDLEIEEYEKVKIKKEESDSETTEYALTGMEALNLSFYNHFVTISWEPDVDTVRFSFPGFGKKKYGLQFKCMTATGDKYNLVQCWLPKTFSMDDTQQNSYPVNYDEIPAYVGIVLENINAFFWRAKQVTKLRSVIDKRIKLHCRPCYTEIVLRFDIITLDSSAKKSVVLYLSYPILHLLPSSIDVISEGDALLQRYLEAIFAVFKEENLTKAYQQAFVNSDQVKFFDD